MPETTTACRTCGFADCPGAATGNCPRWPATDPGLTELTYAQLCDALKASNDEYERRFAAFLEGADTAKEIAVLGLPGLAEATAEIDGMWAECKAQSEMTRAIGAEINARRNRGDYA